MGMLGDTAFFSYISENQMKIAFRLENDLKPRSISSSYSVIARVREVLKRTVVGD